MPDSATLTTSSGSSLASRANVSGSTSSVLRLRALTPTSSAPTARARPTSSSSWTSVRTVRPSSRACSCRSFSERVVERGHDQQHQVGPGGAGLEQLVAGDDEVLAQQRASAPRRARRGGRRGCRRSAAARSAPRSRRRRPAAYAAASAAGSGMSASAPLLGDRRLTSAITDSPGARKAGIGSRGGGSSSAAAREIGLGTGGLTGREVLAHTGDDVVEHGHAAGLPGASIAGPARGVARRSKVLTRLQR